MKASDLKNLDLRELVDELNSLDFENVGGWPTPVKVGAAVLVFIGVLLLGYFLSIKSLESRHQQLQRQEQSLLQSFQVKAFKAHNLVQYRKQLADMEQEFNTLKNQLPKDTEVPGLLEDITHTGLTAGLQFKNISLGDEVQKNFYAELPIHIEVVGDYNSFGQFVSGVAALPRIVTLHDFKITPVNKSKDKSSSGLLDMTITAETYRYLDNQGGGKNGGKGHNKSKNGGRS